MASDPNWINVDPTSGTPEYDAGELRRTQATWLANDTSDRLGARAGIRPGFVPVTISGSTITMHDQPMVIYPAWSAGAGPYTVGMVAQTASLQSANNVNPRRDTVYAIVYDDDQDGSGMRTARYEYLAGVADPSPSPPSEPLGALHIATIDVPASGQGSAAVTNDGPTTVASGGVLPVRGAGEYPADGLYGGYTIWDSSEQALRVWSSTGDAWQTVTMVGVTPRIYCDGSSEPTGRSPGESQPLSWTYGSRTVTAQGGASASNETITLPPGLYGMRFHAIADATGGVSQGSYTARIYVNSTIVARGGASVDEFDDITVTAERLAVRIETGDAITCELSLSAAATGSVTTTNYPGSLEFEAYRKES